MNFKRAIIFLMAIMCSFMAIAQYELPNSRTSDYDSLIIERLSGHTITLLWDFRKNIKNSDNWKVLLDDFKSNFKEVYDNIPEFDFYKIDYVQNQSLVIDEIRGRETYTVNEKDEIIYTKSNRCKLRGEGITIYLEFNDNSELIDSSVNEDIANAINNIKHKFYFSNISKQRHYFNVEKNKMVPPPRPKVSFAMPVGAKVGLLKNQPYMELRPGIGVIVGQQHLVSLNVNFMLHYDELANSRQNDIYLGLNWMAFTERQGLGVEYAVKISEGIEDFDDLAFRAGLNYRTNDGILLGIDYYLRDPDAGEFRNIVWGFSLGFGF